VTRRTPTAEPGSTDHRRRLGAQAAHLAALLLRSSLTSTPYALAAVLGAGPRSGPPGPNSLAADRWIRAE
jgi:hypothetical protein